MAKGPRVVASAPIKVQTRASAAKRRVSTADSIHTKKPAEVIPRALKVEPPVRIELTT